MCHRHVFAALTHSLRRLWLPDVVVQFKIRFTKQKKKAVRLDCFLLLVAEVGFFIALSSSHSRFATQSQIALKTPCFGRHRLQKRATGTFLLR